MSEWLWLVPAGALGAHLAFGRYNARRLHDGWSAFLRPEDLSAIDNVELLVQGDAACLKSSTRGATEAHARGDLPEAVRLLALAYLVVQDAQPDRLGRLRAMLKMARMAVAIRPPEPLPAAAFRLRQLGLLAALSWLAHHLLVQPAERLALRLRTLLLGFRLAFGVLARSRRAIDRQPVDVRAWRAFDRGAADWQCLDRAHLETFKAFVAGLPRAVR